ncbi:MAG: hypothetical protein K2N63_09895 [Lachnospiraceae bacterium]|nr:hypothetical protein [Lachnospiraceae bacterium]
MDKEQRDEIERLRGELDSENQKKIELGKWNARYLETTQRIRELDAAYLRLQQEIQRLEKFSPISLTYRLLFMRKKTLEKKRGELLQLKAQCEEEKGQQKEQKETIRFYENELFRIKGLKRKWEELENNEIENYKSGTGAQDKVFLRLEEEVLALREETGQFRKVLQAAQSAYGIAGEIMWNLEKAEQSGRLDLYGGGLFAAMDKHGHLNAAQKKLENLRIQVEQFKGELVLASLPEELKIGVGGFMKFSDYFFDGLLSDYLVQRKIKEAAVPIMRFRRKMEEILQGMEARLATMEKECARKEELMRQKVFL